MFSPRVLLSAVVKPSRKRSLPGPRTPWGERKALTLGGPCYEAGGALGGQQLKLRTAERAEGKESTEKKRRPCSPRELPRGHIPETYCDLEETTQGLQGLRATETPSSYRTSLSSTFPPHVPKTDI